MNGLLLRWLVSTISLLLIGYLVPGIEVEGFVYALIAAAVLGVLNAIIRPVLIILTLPLTILTLGLFILVLNGFMLMIVSAVIKGFHVHGFWAAFWGRPPAEHHQLVGQLLYQFKRAGRVHGDAQKF